MAKTALIFPGQGSQYLGMGHDSFMLSSLANHIYNLASSILEYDIKDICMNADLEQLPGLPMHFP